MTGIVDSSYRGIVHVHTCFSYDGHDDFAILVDRLRYHQLDFALLTDHVEGFSPARFAEYVTQCHAHSSGDLLLIPGLEYTFGDGPDRIELLLVGDEAFVEATQIEHVWAHKRGKDLIAILPHPVKFRLGYSQLGAHIDLIEVWNRRYDGGFSPPRHNLSLLKAFQHLSRVYAVSGVDYHGPSDPLDLVTIVRSQNLRSSSLLHALRDGNFHTQHKKLFLSSTPQIGICRQIYLQAVRSVRAGIYRAGRWVISYPVVQSLTSAGLRRRLKRILH